jgi:transcriptional regulator with XRE-family HTH domain
MASLPAWICGRCSPPISAACATKLLSQDDLAYEAEISRSYLAQLEKGAYYASLKIIGRLAAALSVEPAELLRASAPPPRKH